MDKEIERLADLLQQRNSIDEQIGALIGRPALPGHICEFIASKVFGVGLSQSASQAAIDGYFTDPPLAGKSADIKFYPKHEGLLDVNRSTLPDFYLVLAGPRTAAMSSRGTTRPLVIESVFLFTARTLHEQLRQRGVKIGIATSVHRALWDAAEIYPRPNPALTLTPGQREALALFAGR